MPDKYKQITSNNKEKVAVCKSKSNDRMRRYLKNDKTENNKIKQIYMVFGFYTCRAYLRKNRRF